MAADVNKWINPENGGEAFPVNEDDEDTLKENGWKPAPVEKKKGILG